MGKEKTIISIISEQTIPNLVFIKEYIHENPGKYNLLFITTGKMEARGTSDDIYRALELNCKHSIGKFTKIETSHDSFQNIKERLESEIRENQKYIVNITGGTKIMSLAVYETMIDNSRTVDSEIYYLTLGKNTYMKIYPNRSIKEILNHVTIEEYLNSYGMEFTSNNVCIRSYDENYKFANKYFPENRNIISELNKLQNIKKIKRIFDKKKELDLNSDKVASILNTEKIDIDKIENFLSLLSISIPVLLRSDLRYITGGWFEELVFQKLKKSLGLTSNCIVMNLEILNSKEIKSNTKKQQNEFDILYIDSRNTLNIIECKSWIDNKLAKETLYKMAALKRYFGLQAKSILYTMTPKEELNGTVYERAEILGIRIITGDFLNND